MSVKLKPIGQYILVKPIVEKESESGIILPDDTNLDRKAVLGEVVSLGSGRAFDSDDTVLEFPVSVGDKVLFNHYGANEVEHGGKTYFFIYPADIFAIEQ